MISIEPIGVIHSPYKEKFAVPRQSGLNNAESVIELNLNSFEKDRLRGLEDFSHLWVIFLFHIIDEVKAKEQILVRPPRLGGSAKKGVYATRTPHRPNRMGLSLVKIKSISENKIHILGGDFVDGTPVLDLKPYIPEDVIPDAKFGWTEEALEISKLEVNFRSHLMLSDSEKEELKELLQHDPRPAHQKNLDKPSLYKVYIKNYNISFSILDEKIMWIEEAQLVKN